MGNAKKLLEELGKHPKAAELDKECGSIKTMSDYAEALLSAAKRLGMERTHGRVTTKTLEEV